MKLKKSLVAIAMLLISFTLVGCNDGITQTTNTNNTKNETSVKKDKNTSSLSKLFSSKYQDKNSRTNGDYTANSPAIIETNNNNPSDSDVTSASEKDFINGHGHIKYSPLDNLKRTQSATAYLTKDNLGSDKDNGGRSNYVQTVKPTGWHQKQIYINGEKNYAVNRGHLIAYTLSKHTDNKGNYSESTQMDSNNPVNLFTQSQFSNVYLQQIVEQKVREGLQADDKLVYKVTPQYNSNDLMANKINFQVKTISGNNPVNLNMTAYNVQPNIYFDYATGKVFTNTSMQVPIPDGASQFNPDNYKKKTA